VFIIEEAFNWCMSFSLIEEKSRKREKSGSYTMIRCRWIDENESPGVVSRRVYIGK